MNTYEVNVSLDCVYVINAPNEEIAMDIAEEYFSQAEPTFEVKKITDDD